MQDIADRRLYPRKQVFIQVDYSATRDESFTGYTDNISEGGMFIGTQNLLAVGADIYLEFRIPKSDLPAKVKGKIVSNMDIGMGIQFEGLDPITQGKISSAIKELGRITTDQYSVYIKRI